MLRPVARPPSLAIAAPRGSEMDADSQHRELSEEKLLLPDSTPTSPEPANGPESQNSSSTPRIAQLSLMGPGLVQANAPIRNRRSTMDLYRKARGSSSKLRRLKKGSVLDEAG